MKHPSLHPHRFFDPDPSVRRIAVELHDSVRDLPLVSPHGHVEARILATDEPFPDPTELVIIPDHYIFRMLYAQGVPLEALGVPTVDGTPVERDHRKIWQLFAANYHLFAGTPTGAWLAYELAELFGIEEPLAPVNALAVYDRMMELLQTKEFRPRALFEHFRIEVLATTDGPSDSLEHHRKLRESPLPGRVIPSFRPDAVVDLLRPTWRREVDALSAACGIEIDSYRDFIRAIEDRRAFFKSLGAVATDQGIESPATHRLSESEAESLFARALKGEATEEDNARFTAHMLMEMARMSVEDGLVMQIHAGALRNHNRHVFRRFGLDKGADIPVATEYTRSLRELLNELGNDPRLTLVVFTLDESTYARELAPLAGHYPAMKLGAPWWFHDSIQGMTRFREQVSETAGFYNTVGFTDDTRAFLSIPARHDLARRLDANFLAGLVARHIIDMRDALALARALAYDLAKRAYKL